MRQFHLRLHLRLYFALLGMIAAFAYSPGVVAVAQEPPGVVEGAGEQATDGMEVMTRGPIHEAFAQPVNSGALDPMAIADRPPESIEEIPPDAKPADETAIWIGGYWAWNDDQKDFIWVSGVWRISPPGQRWVAGYWIEVPGGFSWVPGFWSPAEQEELAYYPEPPATLEQGPTSEPPSQDHVWVSGCWRWTDSRYAWQPGYWVVGQMDWVWMPSSYYWSPRGWVFRHGYWDHRLDRRGLYFAPVRFSRAIYRQPGYSYSPSVVIDGSLLTFYLFVRPTYNHYYFGDYYAANYDRLGIYPWFSVRAHRSYAYDPLFSYYAWRNHRHDPNWARNLAGWHAYYRVNPNQRLAHNLTAARQVAAAAGERPDRQFLNVANDLQRLRDKPDSPLPLAGVTAEQKTQFRENARLMRQFGTDRGRMESEGIAGRAEGRTNPQTPDAAQPRMPETLQLPRVARRLTETTPIRPDSGGVRQTLKPIVPPPEPPEERGRRVPGALRRPSAAPDQPEREARPPDRPARPDRPETRPSDQPARPDRPETRPPARRPGSEPGDVRRPSQPPPSESRPQEGRRDTPPRETRKPVVPAQPPARASEPPDAERKPPETQRERSDPPSRQPESKGEGQKPREGDRGRGRDREEREQRGRR